MVCDSVTLAQLCSSLSLSLLSLSSLLGGFQRVKKMKKAVRRLTLKKIDRTESTDSPFSTNIPGGDGSEHPKSLSARSASNGPHVEWKHVKADQIRSRNQEEDSELSLQTNESSSSSSSSFSSRSFKRRTSKGEDFLKFAKRQSSGGIVTRSRANTTITSPIQPTSHSRSPRARHKSQRFSFFFFFFLFFFFFFFLFKRKRGKLFFKKIFVK